MKISYTPRAIRDLSSIRDSFAKSLEAGKSWITSPERDLCEKRYHKNLRHPERSEAKNIFFQLGKPERSRRTQPRLPEMPKRLRFHPCKAGLPLCGDGDFTVPSLPVFMSRRSFGSGSASSFCQTNLPLAFAQDDGHFFSVRHFRRGLWAELLPAFQAGYRIDENALAI